MAKTPDLGTALVTGMGAEQREVTQYNVRTQVVVPLLQAVVLGFAAVGLLGGVFLLASALIVLLGMIYSELAKFLVCCAFVAIGSVGLVVIRGIGKNAEYEGRDLRTAHAGMNVSEQEFVATIDDIVAALASHGVARPETDEVVAILYSLKDEVLRQ